MANDNKVTVEGLTEVEAGRLSARLLWMKATGLLSGKVEIYETTCREPSSNGLSAWSANAKSLHEFTGL